MENLPGKNKILSLIKVYNIAFWTFGVTLRVLPTIIKPWRKVYVDFTRVLIIVNIICVFILVVALFNKQFKLNESLLLLFINILALVLGTYFIAFPIMIM